ncbi:MAG: peptidoglycan-binding protein [Patescibacteria group bacterium]
MKKLLISGSIAVFLLPVIAFGAYNDVTLTTDTIISINSISLTVSGSSASIESIVVGSSDFTVTLQPGSTIAVTSSVSSTLLSANAGAPIKSITCGSTPTLTLTSTALSDIAVIVAASSGTCVTASATVAASSGGSSGGSGGIVGGGSGGMTSATPATPATPTVTPATPATPASSAFSADFGVGAKGDSVTALQTFLESKGFLTMPAGVAKGTFGALTRSAVRAYQEEKGIPATGFVGPLTRATLNSSAKTEAAQTTSTALFSFTTNMQFGSRGKDVTELQKLLIAQGFLNAEATGYFGKLTEAAVKSYQTKNGISSIGIVGPATRASLNK